MFRVRYGYCGEYGLKGIGPNKANQRYLIFEIRRKMSHCYERPTSNGEWGPEKELLLKYLTFVLFIQCSMLDVRCSMFIG